MQSPSEPAIANEALQSPLSLGIVGCSLARPRYGAAFALSPSTRVSALVDPDAKYTRAWSRLLGGEIALYADLQAMIASGTVPDALVIDVPMSERAETISAAIPACRAILCAPPFASTLEETDRLLYAARTHNTLLAPAFPRRGDPVLAQAIEMATTGEIGLIQQIRCDWSFPLARAYGAEIGADPDAGSWGALLQIVGCHAADVCRWCFGDVLTVSADIDEHTLAPAAGSRRDTAPLLANLVLGQENGPATCHFARSRAVSASERYTFSGSLGNLEVVVSSSTNPADSFPAITLHRPGMRPQGIPPEPFEGSDLPAPVFRMLEMLESFAELAQDAETGDESAPVAEGARAALEVMHAAWSSAHDRRKITLPLRRSPDFLVK